MTSARRVLLVVPEDDFAREFRARLMREGAEVTTAPTGAEALTVAREGFDVVILDLELPDIDALSVLHELRKLHNSTGCSARLFLRKGEGEPAHVVQRGLDLGASGYVIKHRLPRDPKSTPLLDLLIGGDSRPDACPFSASREFGRCTAFLQLNVGAPNGRGEALVSCSHLRVGTADTWRLYPRCAIGDQAARDRYQEDKTPV